MTMNAASFATLENAALSMDWNTVIDICGGSHNIVANWIWGHAVEAKCGAPHNRQVFIMELLEKIRIA